VTTVVRWSGTEAQALREARPMSVRTFTARPDGVLWEHLSRDKIAAIPVLACRASGHGSTEVERRWS
jgi:hypothetical protein